MGGKLHLMLRMCSRPIAHKYHEGKMKRTLERELKVTEIAEWEADGSSGAKQIFHALYCSSVASMQMMQCSARCQAWSFFALSVNDNSLPRNRVATCNPCFGKVLLCCRTRWRIPFSCSDVVLQMLSAITLACSCCSDALNSTMTT